MTEHVPTDAELNIRYPEVQRFASLMLTELYANRHKGDQVTWRAVPSPEWSGEIAWHFMKLMAAYKEQNWIKVIEHAADVANGAMMMLDSLGLLASNAQPDQS